MSPHTKDALLALVSVLTAFNTWSTIRTQSRLTMVQHWASLNSDRLLELKRRVDAVVRPRSVP